MSTEYRNKYLAKYLDSEDFELQILCCRMLMDIYNITCGKSFSPMTGVHAEDKKNAHENMQKLLKVFEDYKKFIKYFDDNSDFFIPYDKLPIVKEQNLDIKNRVLKKLFLTELEVIDEKEKRNKQNELKTSLDITRRTVVSMLLIRNEVLKAENLNQEAILAFNIDDCFETYNRLVPTEIREILVQDFGKGSGKPDEKTLDGDKK